jgi:hypothetical protein
MAIGSILPKHARPGERARDGKGRFGGIRQSRR